MDLQNRLDDKDRTIAILNQAHRSFTQGQAQYAKAFSILLGPARLEEDD